LSKQEGKTYRLPTEAEWNTPAGQEQKRRFDNVDQGNDLGQSTTSRRLTQEEVA